MRLCPVTVTWLWLHPQLQLHLGLQITCPAIMRRLGSYTCMCPCGVQAIDSEPVHAARPKAQVAHLHDMIEASVVESSLPLAEDALARAVVHGQRAKENRDFIMMDNGSV